MKSVKLGEVCTIVSGTTPKTSVAEYWDGQIKWITPAELDENSFYIYDTARHITELGKSKSGLLFMPQGTVILSSRAPIGKNAIAGCEMCCNQGFKNLICSDRVFNEYLYYFLSAKTDYLNSLGRGATFKEISKGIVENIVIPLPNIEEQKAISEQFEQINILIASRKEQIQLLDDLVKSRFIEMFGEPTINPLGWNLKKWAEVLTIKNGKNQSQVEDENGEYVICGSGGVMGKATNYITSANSVIVGRKGNINKPILMREPFWNVDTAFGIEPNREMLTADYLFLFCLFFDFERLNKAVTIPSLTKSDLLEIDIPIPPLELQNQFTTFVEQVDKSKYRAEFINKMEVAA